MLARKEHPFQEIPLEPVNRARERAKRWLSEIQRVQDTRDSVSWASEMTAWS
jgi:hypothetical protein